MAQRERNVKIVVSAEAKGLAQVQSKVSKFQAAVEKTKARRVDVFKAHMDVQRTAEAYDRASMEARKYAAALKSQRDAGKLTSVSEGHLRAAVERSTLAAKNAKVAMNAKRDALHRVTQAGNANAAQMRNAKMAAVAQATATKGEAAAANSATVALNKLNKATARTTKEQKTAARATDTVTVAMRKQGIAAKQSAAWATRQGRGPLGLRPYELTNLSYQINDVVSGLAMGQRPMQIFAQQSGQIIQIFPKIMMGLIKLVPVLAAASLAFGPLVLGVVQLSKEANNIRYFETELALMGQTAVYSAENLAEVALAADRTGVSLEDAQAAIVAFTAAGIGEGNMGGFVKMAKQLADVTGEDVPEAAKKLAKAFEGGIDSVRELDQEMNFLTASQYENIRALESQGRETDALRVAQEALADKMDEIAEKAGAGGEWGLAARNLGDAWGSFIGYMSQTWLVDQMTNSLQGLAFMANLLASGLPGASGLRVSGEGATFELTDPAQPYEERIAAAREYAEEYESLGKSIEATAGVISRAEEGRAGAIVTGREDASQLTFLRAKLAADRARLAEIEAELRFGAQAGPTPQTPEERVSYLEREAALREIARKAAIDAGAAISLSIDEQNEATERSIYLAGLSNEERFVSVGMRKFELELAKQALEQGVELEEVDSRILANHERLLRAQFAAEDTGGGGSSAARKEEIAEMELVNRLLEYRTQLQTLLDAQELDGDIVGAAQTTEELEQVSVELDDAIIKALMFWEAMGGEDADVAIAKLKELQLELKQTGEEALFTGKFINEGITDVMVGAFSSMAKAIAEGTSATQAFFQAFRKGAGEFLIQIGEMILQRAILNALSGGGGVNGGVGGGIAGFLNKILQFHEGGVVGAGGSSRMVPSTVFAGAARFHEGGLPGLKSNEVAAVLEKGEEVLTRDDSRNVLNGAGGGNGDVKVVLVNSPAEAQRQNFQDTEFQKVHMEWMQENSNEINSMLGR